MYLDGISQTAIREFWSHCRDDVKFPLPIERYVAKAFPVFIVRVPSLSVKVISEWLSKRASIFSTTAFSGPDRLLRGCLVAALGKAIIFVDGADPENEVRFSLAHEIAHFIVDYWLPRNAVLKRFGPNISEVADGRRDPTTSERLSALLGETNLSFYIDMLSRDTSASMVSADLDEIEERTDRIACEILAPLQTVLKYAHVSGRTYRERSEAMKSVLTERFGLPASQAAHHSSRLLARIRRGPSWAEKLKD
jgi:hypothetical protein